MTDPVPGEPSDEAASPPAEPDSGSAQESVSKAVSGSSMFLLGRLLAVAVSIGVQGALSRHLARADLGALLFGMSVVGLMSPFITLGQDRAVTRHLVVYQEQRRPDRMSGTIVLYVASVLSLAAVAFVGAVAVQDLVVRRLAVDQAGLVVAIMVLLAPLESLDRMLEGCFAVLGRPSAIFIRRYVMSPIIKAGVVFGLVAADGDVEHFAYGLVGAALAGVLLYAVQAPALFRSHDMTSRPAAAWRAVPKREVFGYSMPLMTSEFPMMTIASVSPLILGWRVGSDDVATYRVIWPAARLNLVVVFTFSMLVLPAITRHHARREFSQLNELYWRVATWMVLISFPIFAVTCLLPTSTVRFLFGAEYSSSATVLALLSIGAFLDIMFGYNQQTLQIYGSVRWVMGVNVAVASALALAVFLMVPAAGAVGAAGAGLGAMLVRNLLNHWKLVRTTTVSARPPVALRLVLSIVVAAAAVPVLASLLGSGLPLGYVGELVVVGVVWIGLLIVNSRALAVSETFPAIARLPGWKYVESWLSSRSSRRSPD